MYYSMYTERETKSYTRRLNNYEKLKYILLYFIWIKNKNWCYVIFLFESLVNSYTVINVLYCIMNLAF